MYNMEYRYDIKGVFRYIKFPDIFSQAFYVAVSPQSAVSFVDPVI